MSISLYMDVHVPAAIIRALRARGIDVLTAQEDGARRFTDSELLDRSTALQRVLFTQDDDFLVETARRQRQHIPFSGVIYGHQRRLSEGQCAEDLELIAAVYDPADVADRLFYLPL